MNQVSKQNNPISTALVKRVVIIFLLFLFAQILVLYQLSVALDGDETTSTTKVQSESLVKQTQISSNIECTDITNENDCNSVKHCFSIYGTTCGGSILDKKFISCIPQYAAIPEKKMEMDPRIPPWSAGHPDFKYICAENPATHEVLRFESFVPAGWKQSKCYDCCIKPAVANKKDKKLSLVTLVYREFDSFNNSLVSWKKNGLLDLVDEAIVYINARVEGDPIDSLAKEYGLKILGSSENIGIGKAIAQLVLHAKNNFILFLEKDWEAVEPKEVIRRQLDLSKDLILSEVNGSRADAVKLRSRKKAGHPNIAESLCIPPDFDMVELSAWAQFRPINENEGIWWLPHLFCNIYHFQNDQKLFAQYPNRIWKCGCDQGFLCFDSAQCGWTNNPMIFKKHWFLDTLYEISQSEEHTFEGATYYSKEWIEPHWVIAEGDGFFMHHEINEHL